VISTNPIVNRDGAAAMGLGISVREAWERIPGLEYHLRTTSRSS
jgi:hypothetical protein